MIVLLLVIANHCKYFMYETSENYREECRVEMFTLIRINVSEKMFKDSNIINIKNPPVRVVV